MITPSVLTKQLLCVYKFYFENGGRIMFKWDCLKYQSTFWSARKRFRCRLWVTSRQFNTYR